MQLLPVFDSLCSLKVDGCYADWTSMNQTYPELSEVLRVALLAFFNIVGDYICDCPNWPSHHVLMLVARLC
jgi:hypothetical protein